MMESPQSFIEEQKDKSYEELLKVRDELIVDILYFEKHYEEQMQDELCICPSPDLVYQFNLEYLGELCKLISEKFNETMNIPEEDKEIMETDITEREKEILDLTVKGLTVREIAETLNIQKATATAHTHNLLSKFKCNSRSELIDIINSNKTIYK